MIALLLALACGSERTAVKDLRDAPELATTKAVVSTIAGLRALPSIRWSNDAPRSLLWEREVAGVAASIVGFKLEDDADWHVVIATGSGVTMIAELPDPGCASSPEVKAVLTKARQQFLAVVGRAPTKKYRAVAPIPVAIAGVVFLDKVHGQTGVAPNGVELHPVTWVSRRRR